MHIPADLSHEGSMALLSPAGIESKDTAIVFVHGFMGSPFTTWLEFPALIDNLANEFRGYESVRVRRLVFSIVSERDVAIDGKQ
jgi:hypothetical protein